MRLPVYRYNAFATQPDKGNPAAIVFAADALTEVQMQAIAREVGFNETAFVCRSSCADLRLRFFTPGHEMALCGHATIATCVALYDHQCLPSQELPLALTIETQAACLPIVLTRNSEQQLFVSMRQNPAQFVPFDGSVAELADALGLDSGEIDSRYPVVYGSTGIWTLLVPLRTLAACARMEPQSDRFPELLQQFPRASVHPFCLETYDPLAQMHGRHFSSPFSGTKEDPITGTASGVMGAYYIEYIQRSDAAHLLIEQGFEVKRDGRVSVEVERTAESIKVLIAGTAVFVSDWNIEIGESVV